VRKPMAVANWKMNKNNEETRQFLREYMAQASGLSGTEVVICPPFTLLPTLQQELCSLNAPAWGGQNCFWEDKGAYTGEISAPMLKELGCSYVIIGHSERRMIMGETDEQINKKLKAVLSCGLMPILCVGETLQQRENNAALSVVKNQLDKSLQDLALQPGQMVIAYEPVWAIGTGVNASSDDAREMIAYIRSRLRELFNDDLAASTRILYGGSVRDDNTAELMAKPDIDGALIGGASLEADSFVRIARIIANG
jgi:triosephosphate isomerase